MIKTVTTGHDMTDTKTALFHAVEVVKKRIRMRLEQKGAGLFVDPHQIYGIVAEEMKEFMDALHGNDTKGMKDELLDIAAAAIWGYASLTEAE